MTVTSVEEALCRQFGTSPKGNWYREGLTSKQQLEPWATWQNDIAARLPELQYKWDQHNYCNSPSSTWTDGGEYTLEDEWFNNKAKDLFPTHPWYVAATAVSFCCLMVWILLSPHRGERAKRLDVTCTLNSSLAVCRDNLLFRISSVYPIPCRMTTCCFESPVRNLQDV